MTDRKIISVPVGCEPTRRAYYGSKLEYVSYGYKPSIDIETSLDNLIEKLSSLREKTTGYVNLQIDLDNDCGCRSECSCSPTYYLKGDRLENDLEYNFRIKREAACKIDQEKRDIATFEALKKKLGK